MLTPERIKIAKYLQGDIPLNKRPFLDIGKKLTIEEALVIKALKYMKKKGAIRKFGAIVRHQRAGYAANAMVIWAVPESQCESTGNMFAAYPEITHCYERTPAFEGKYNIFCMVHFGKTGMGEMIQKMSSAASIEDYKILVSEEEFKKSSMEYF
jgi:siroheme decarboxylase